jgi:hypothetical protein
VKRLAAVFASSALAAATVGLAQQATQQTQTQPPASTSQATSPSDPSTGKADKQALMKDCMAKVAAANPGASEKAVKAYCDKQVQGSSTPQD